jgi:hypothetical protein
MPRVKRTELTERLHLELPERLRVRLGVLRGLTGADSLQEVIRMALGLYDALLALVKLYNARLILRREDGTEREVTLP